MYSVIRQSFDVCKIAECEWGKKNLEFPKNPVYFFLFACCTLK